MAKVSPVSIKYMIRASFKSEGPLEKPDVIGAVFGQTEGLLGNDLEMRELQKEGKIGRIEVDLEIVDGKSVGVIKIPTALDKSETTLIGAALETIERIGPTEAQITVESIQDVRADKRSFILERAKKLMESMESGQGFGEMAQSLKEESRAEKIQEYGEERLPAGDLSGNEIIVVEGRADVVNLLRNRVNNVIGMAGAKLPKEIAKLGESKEITLFVDGDRGGKLIANNVISNANVVYVAVAPDGKEVEELTGKEILLALRRKITSVEYLKKNGNSVSEKSNDYGSNEESRFQGDHKERLREVYSKNLEGSKSAMLLDIHMDSLRKISARDVGRAIKDSRKKVLAVVIDGTATKTLVKICEDSGIKYLAATNFSDIGESSIELISL